MATYTKAYPDPKQWPSYMWPPQVGMYGCDEGSCADSDHVCPYCHGPLFEARGNRRGRIVDVQLVNGRYVATFEMLADGLNMFGCETCHQMFTAYDRSV